jgi:hypothetical protein
MIQTLQFSRTREDTSEAAQKRLVEISPSIARVAGFTSPKYAMKNAVKDAPARTNGCLGACLGESVMLQGARGLVSRSSARRRSKDLRILNDSEAAICFRVSVERGKITACLCSPACIESCAVDFVKIAETDGICTVETRRRHPGEEESRVETVSCYSRMTQAGVVLKRTGRG